MIVGARVMKKGWLGYPERYHHLARLGRVTRVANSGFMEVRWDAGELGAPAVRKMHRPDELAHIWWRAT